MDPFISWTAIAAPLDIPSIDTNQICPTRFNKRAKGAAFDTVLFHDLRFTPQGAEQPNFILNRDPYRHAGIFVAERNFGCGSSRESAVYALMAFGIRALVAPVLARFFTPTASKTACYLWCLTKRSVRESANNCTTAQAPKLPSTFSGRWCVMQLAQTTHLIFTLCAGNACWTGLTMCR